MTTSLVRGRYAPSPTGELHLGNARTALVAWLGARAANGQFVMRIEDLDPPRLIPGAEERLIEDLRWLGLDWDEGPEGGPYAPYRQSERDSHYRDALARLDAAGLLYGCTCSRAELRRLASAPHGPGEEGPPYPGLCRDKQLALDEKVDGRLPALRFRMPPETIGFTDLIHGPYAQALASEVGDMVLRRADGLYAYQLAVVVDDALMAIDQVVRGADLLGSTPRQIALQRALGYPQPAYAHVPLVLNEEGERLAKRDRPSSLRLLREAGYRPETLLGVLGASLGLIPTASALSARELLAEFRWAAIRTSPWILSLPGAS